MTNFGRFRNLPHDRAAAILNTVLLLPIACLMAVLASPTAAAQTFGTIYAFNGVNGAAPSSGVTIRAGVLYGTTLAYEYCSGSGTVYQIKPRGGKLGIYYPSSLFSGPNGASPEARVVFGPDNHLYGTTQIGGPQSTGNVFNLTPQCQFAGPQTASGRRRCCIISRAALTGDAPGCGDLIWDPMGNIYGTTSDGGTSDLGTVYQMTKSGNTWMEMPIYSFTGPDGTQPVAGVDSRQQRQPLWHNSRRRPLRLRNYFRVDL